MSTNPAVPPRIVPVRAADGSPPAVVPGPASPPPEVPLPLRALDAVFAPVTALSGAWLKMVRRAGVHRMPVARELLRRIGVFPVRDHYYEPMFDPKHLRHPLSDVRRLPGLDLNVEEQLALLRTFRYQDELTAFPLLPAAGSRFHYDNGSFESGDAEFLYSMVRHFRPRRLFEIGSGNSTRIAAEALLRNRVESPVYSCDHLCVEPYEQPWLAEAGVRLVRERVETLDPAIFDVLDRNDILFIDSSHVIRPQGDVLFEYLEILPRLKTGVIVHVHDIFTPRDLPREWVEERVRFWNEQYLLEAFLSCNRDFRVIGAVNFLKHEHGAALGEACPILRFQPYREPGSFWIVRN